MPHKSCRPFLGIRIDLNGGNSWEGQDKERQPVTQLAWKYLFMNSFCYHNGDKVWMGIGMLDYSIPTWPALICKGTRAHQKHTHTFTGVQRHTHIYSGAKTHTYTQLQGCKDTHTHAHTELQGCQDTHLACTHPQAYLQKDFIKWVNRRIWCWAAGQSESQIWALWVSQGNTGSISLLQDKFGV